MAKYLAYAGEAMPISAENRKRYPSNWGQISDSIRFTRAHRRCEFLTLDGKRCTAVHGKPHPHTGSIVVLTVAHLDHCPEHCAPTNLRAGCQCCHNRYDLKHRINNAQKRRRANLQTLEMFP